MVDSKKQNTAKHIENQGEYQTEGKSNKINASTHYATCDARMTAFGGLLSFVKFIDLLKFEEVFEQYFVMPKRQCSIGHYKMFVGIMVLIFIGFQRLGHFAYIQTDSMICGLLDVTKLPVISTFWRFLRSMGYNQARSLLRMSGVLRKRVWELCGIEYTEIGIDIDTTVSTVYGEIEGSRKGHNTKHRGKKGLRPVLLFIEQTREYICGSQRRGETITNNEVARQILEIDKLLPACVKKVLIRGDGEFIGVESIAACERRGYSFIFGNRRCSPPFPNDGWYRYKEFEYNEVLYQPLGWEKPMRFVVMRIPKGQKEARQLDLFDDGTFMYRIFVTNLTQRPHKVIIRYDKRADVENCIGEAQREGILAIPSKNFHANGMFFQLVMLTYNLWRWMKLTAGNRYNSAYSEENEDHCSEDSPAMTAVDKVIIDNTIRIARLKMLFVPAKVVNHADKITIKYSSHDARTEGIIDFLKYLDKRRSEKISWKDDRRISPYKKTA